MARSKIRSRKKNGVTGKVTSVASLKRLLNSLRGCCKGPDSLVAALYRGRQEESYAERHWKVGRD